MFCKAEVIHGEFGSEPLLLKSSAKFPLTSVLPEEALREHQKGKDSLRAIWVGEAGLFLPILFCTSRLQNLSNYIFF